MRQSRRKQADRRTPRKAARPARTGHRVSERFPSRCVRRRPATRVRRQGCGSGRSGRANVCAWPAVCLPSASWARPASCRLQDMTGRIQLFLQQTALGDTYEAFKSWDVGDIVGAEGALMRTKTGELSVKVRNVAIVDQVAAAAAGQVAWPGRRRATLSPALRRPDHHARIAPRVCVALGRLIRFIRALARGAAAALHGSRDADDARDTGRRHGAAVRDASQCARYGPVSCALRRSCT